MEPGILIDLAPGPPAIRQRPRRTPKIAKQSGLEKFLNNKYTLLPLPV